MQQSTLQKTYTAHAAYLHAAADADIPAEGNAPSGTAAVHRPVIARTALVYTVPNDHSGSRVTF